MNSVSYIVTYTFIHNVHWVVLFAQPGYQDTGETISYSIFIFFPTFIVGVWIL